MQSKFSSFVRTLVALAIAIATAGVDVGHGLAHEADHHDNPSHVTAASSDAIDSASEHREAHPHERVSDALRIRGNASDFVAVSTIEIVQARAAPTGRVPIPIADARQFGDRATGPPPRLRAPPID